MRSMTKTFGLPILTALVLSVPSEGVAQSTPLEGAWVINSWGGEAAQPGLWVFTKTHYSAMFVLGDEARAGYEGENQTDEEVLAAYGPFIANSGRYEVDGDQLTTRAFVAKDTNYMNSWPDNATTYTFRIEDGFLHLTVDGDGPASGQTAILRQVDDQPGPGSN